MQPATSAAAPAAPAPSLEERSFVFHPPPATPPRLLAPATRDRFAQDGWCGPLPLLDPPALTRLTTVLDRLLQIARERGAAGYGVENWHRSARTLWDLVHHPRLVAAACDLLGPDVVCWSTHCFCKEPGDERVVSWHQDAPYWPLTPTRTVTAWIAIDAVDAENGAMQVLPGSHRLGRLPLRPSEPEERNVLWLTTSLPEGAGPPQTVAMPAGSVSFHADLLVHGSPANRSARRRCAVAVRYAATAVRTLGGRIPAIRVHGRWSDHWDPCPRPTDDAAPAPA